jgi:hypothetical protein
LDVRAPIFEVRSAASVNAFSFSIEKKRVDVFLKGKCACSKRFQLPNLHAHLRFKKMMQATALTGFNALNFIGAAKACSLVFLYSSHFPIAHTSLRRANRGVRRAPAPGVWGSRGSLARYKARTQNGTVAASLFPPQKNKAATDRASTRCEVSV